MILTFSTYGMFPASIRGILRGDYCMFDYFAEYFVLPRNGSIIEVSRFIHMIKYHTPVGFKNNIRIICIIELCHMLHIIIIIIR